MAAVATLRVLRRAGHFASRPEPDLKTMLDLVALATVCDVMPLAGLNRAFVAGGLRIMGARGRPGIAALLDVAQAKTAPTAMTCGFALGPRINAGGRIGEADLGLRLLLTEAGRGEPAAPDGRGACAGGGHAAGRGPAG
jgi:single-stranded-DNA-specific exonuclease